MRGFLGILNMTEQDNIICVIMFQHKYTMIKADFQIKTALQKYEG